MVTFGALISCSDTPDDFLRSSLMVEDDDFRVLSEVFDSLFGTAAAMAFVAVPATSDGKALTKFHKHAILLCLCSVHYKTPAEA